METSHSADHEQARFWDDRAGDAWVELREILDGLFAPLRDLLVAEVEGRAARRVLDVGCGTGATTLAAARSLGPGGVATGVDVSAAMLAAARDRAEREAVPARFLLADAQTQRFEPDSFDLLISRFGVMFFPDPVAAFANLRRAAAPGAALRFIAWRGREENPFMTAAERAAAPLLAELPPAQPGAPGQFAFAAAERTRAILTESGWAAAALRPLDVACVMPESQLMPYVSRLGPVGRAIHAADDRTRAEVLATIRPAFDPFVEAGEVRFTAACWMLEAQAPAAGS